MTHRLPAELQRLYLPPLQAAGDAQVRAVVLELARPADWDALSKVWRGVQQDLGLPAPAIAVNGSDGYQLWFSLAQAVPVSQALAFAEGLRARYLDHIASKRLGLKPVDATMALPPRQTGEGQWSAFVAPDLAPVFAEESWLDVLPNAEGQADLLARLDSIKPDDFRAALERLGPAVAPLVSRASEPEFVQPASQQDPRAFLLQVMNDESVEMGLRIEAAKALLHRG